MVATLPADQLMSAGEVATLAGVDPSRIRAWRLWGGLPSLAVGGRHVYLRVDVEQFLRDRERRLMALEASGKRRPPGVRKPTP